MEPTADIKAHFDAQCPRCRRRFGWYGAPADRPTCPGCSYRPPQTAIDADAKQINDFRQMLAEMQEANPGWERWREARIAAGLGLRRAALAMSITPSDLSAIERGEHKPTPDLAGRMAALYGGDE